MKRLKFFCFSLFGQLWPMDGLAEVHSPSQSGSGVLAGTERSVTSSLGFL